MSPLARAVVAPALLGVVAFSVSTAAPGGDDWPVFRGNARQTGVAASQLADNLVVRWKFQARDSVEGTAAIADGTVYVGSEDEFVYALDLETGALRWKFKAGPVKAPVAARGGLAYAGNLDGMFYCLDGATGKERWKFEAGAEVTSGANFAGDMVLFGSGDENLYCLGADGKLAWKFKVAGGPVLGSPAVAGGHTFVSGCDSNLHVLDVSSGREVAGSVNLEGQTGATGAVVGERLYVGTMTNQVLAVDWKKGEVAWRFEPPRHPRPFYASAAVTADRVLAGSRDRNVYALDRATGREVWHFATGDKVDSSPVVVGNRVFVGSMDGNLYALDLATGAERARYRLGKGILASPAVAHGRLVIGTDEGTIYCLGPKP